MASWKKVIVEGAAASLGSLTLTTTLAAAQGGTGITNFANSTHLNANTTKGDVGLGSVENTALSTYTGNGGALDNQYIANGAGYITSFTNTVDMGDGFDIGVDTNTNDTTITEGETLTFTGGTGISTETTANGTVTFTNTAPFSGDVFDNDGTFASLRAQATTKGDVGLGSVENTALSTYTGNGGALDNQYIANGAGYITSFTNTVDMGDGFTVSADTNTATTTITENDTLTLSGGTGVSTLSNPDGTITITNTAPAGATHLNSNTTKGDVGLGSVENTALSTYTGNGGALDNQYIANGAGYITTAGTVDDVSNDNLRDALAALESAGGAANENITIGADSGDTIVITGNLQVNGTTTTIDTTNLNVTDQWINLNDGGAAADGGIVIEGDGVSFGWDNSAGRWGYLSTGATEGQTAPANDAFAAQVVTNDTVVAYRKNGNIQISSGDIYIYVE
jgi:hypothetical protein